MNHSPLLFLSLARQKRRIKSSIPKSFLTLEQEDVLCTPNTLRNMEFISINFDIPSSPRNVDGTENKIGKITHFTWIRTEIDGQLYLERLWICNIGSSDIIFGLPWFQEYNPSINWKTGRINMP